MILQNCKRNGGINMNKQEKEQLQDILKIVHLMKSKYQITFTKYATVVSRKKVMSDLDDLEMAILKLQKRWYK